MESIRQNIVYRSILYSITTVGILWAWEDLSTLKLSNLKADGNDFSYWGIEILVWFLFVRTWHTQPYKIGAAICTPILYTIAPDAVSPIVLLLVVDHTLVTQGYRPNPLPDDVHYYGFVYMLYKLCASLNVSSALRVLDHSVTIPLQWGLVRSNLGGGYIATHPWLVWSSIVSINKVFCRSRSDWLLALISQSIILRCWPPQWLSMVIAIRVFKYMHGGSFIVADRLTSAIVWPTLVASSIIYMWLSTSTVEAEEKFEPTDWILVTSTLVVPFCIFLIVGVMSVAYLLTTEKAAKVRLDYFNWQRRDKLFGSTATVSRKAEPFVDRASRINASWYSFHMPTTDLNDAQCIRLVRFTQFEGEIRLEVAAFSSGQGLPSYFALSYTCGDPDSAPVPVSSQEELHCIHCNEQAFHTRTNLYNALAVFQRARLDSWFWVDTICINQEDPDKRLNQVARMGQIYCEAKAVLLWTGPSTPETADAVAFCKGEFELVPGQGSVQRWSGDSASIGGALRAVLTGQQDLPFSRSEVTQRFAELATSLTALWLRQWSHRAWILQEIALAKSIQVYCGDTQLSWDMFENSLEYVQNPGDVTAPAFRRDLQSIRAKLPRFGGSGRKHKRYWLSIGGTIDAESTRAAYLLYLAAATKTFQCSDPRDKIFCVMGMANLDTPASDDLSKLHLVYDTTVEDLYYWTAHYCIIACPSLACLSLVGPRYQPKYHLPTWVPDFSSTAPIRPLLFIDSLGYGLHGKLFNGSKKQIDGPVLHTYGKIIDSVAEVLHMELGDLLSSTITSLDPMFGFLNKTTPRGLSGHTAAEALWRMLVCTPRSKTSTTAVTAADFCIWLKSKLHTVFATKVMMFWAQTGCPSGLSNFHVEELIRLSNEFAMDHAALRVTSNACAGLMNLPKAEDILQGDPGFDMMQRALQVQMEVQQSLPFRKAMAPVCTERRLFRTRQGYIGLAVRSVQPGDYIVALKASKVPFVLRERQQHPEGSMKPMFPDASRWAEQDYTTMLSEGRFQKPKVGAFQVVGEAYLHGFMGGEKADEVACTEEDTICLI